MNGWEVAAYTFVAVILFCIGTWLIDKDDD
jgi:hypothetical protein